MSDLESSSACQLQPSTPSRELVVVGRPEAWSQGEPQAGAAAKLFPSRFHLAAMGALAVLVAVAGALLVQDREQARALTQQTTENEALTHTVKAMKARLDAIDIAMTNAGLSDLRQSVGEIRSNLVSTREFNGAMAQLSQRVDKLDHEASAKVDKLTERVDHQASAVTAGLSGRIDKLEQKLAAASPAQVAQAKPPSTRPRFDNVSADRTGSIDRPRPLLQGYVVLGARDDVALVGGRYGEREVRQGDFLPGAGRVERIELGGNGWVVTTSAGVIASADFPRY